MTELTPRQSGPWQLETGTKEEEEWAVFIQ